MFNRRKAAENWRKPEPWDAAQKSMESAERRMHKKWGWYAWTELCRPELAQKYRAANERYLAALRSREAGVVIKCCENLVKGMKTIDLEISQEHKPDDFNYLMANVEGKNYYFVADSSDAKRVQAFMKGKNPVIYTVEEVLRIVGATPLEPFNDIKSMFPGAEITEIQLKVPEGKTQDEIPF